MLKRLLLIALLFDSMHLAQAHDPGLSWANAQLHEAGIAIHMVFARQDIEALLPMDTDHDGTVTEGEFSAAQTDLQSILTAGVEVRSAKEKRQPKLVHIETAPSDAVNFNLYYETTQARAIEIHIPLISRLARGHRQFLSVQDANDNLLAQYILDSTSPPILLQQPKSGAATGLFGFALVARLGFWTGEWLWFCKHAG